LPAGNDQLDSLAWQPVPGAPGASIYPLIRKIDTISSNSYLVATPDVIILIDPGGLPEQVEQMSRVISECRAENDRPVFVFLTHAHIDHFIGVQSNPSFAHPDVAVFAVQQAGAAALETGDSKITQAHILQVPISPMKIGLHLFSEDRACIPGVAGTFCFSQGATITIVRDRTPDTPDGLPHERITFGPGPALDLYHTPGHSPDSICLRLGDLLFIGDLLFAASPGVAGLAGWSQESLLHSLSGIENLLSTGGIRMVCPGHGRVIPVPDSLRMTSVVRSDALALTNIAELNHDRAVRTAAFAEDCMEQVNELFTIMAGRLYYVSYVLDELGESGMAEEASALIRSDTIDELLEAFRDFSEAHHRGRKASVHMALKAAQVTAKLDRVFNRDELAGIIDQTLVQRAGRLLSDYSTMLRGFAPPGEISGHELAPVVEAVVTGLSISACSDEDVLSSSDDAAAFSRILLSRLGAPPLLEDVEITVPDNGVSLGAFIDREHFIDLLTYILEDLVGTGANRIEIRMKPDAGNAVVMVSGNAPSPGSLQKRRTWRFLQGLSIRAGGRLELDEVDGMQRFLFTAKAA
jgi:glyoxylase-like metal-dependent hydrolase (beta-lactamase superfamily II)